MLLTITYNGPNALDLGYLLFKNPYRPRSFELTKGRAHVFFQEISPERSTVALLLDLDPLDLAKGRENSGQGWLFDYVNDRPYVCSSFLSVALAKVFGTAMSGRGDERQELADAKLDLSATVTALPRRGDKDLPKRLFEPLGYQTQTLTYPLDENFPAWGESQLVTLTITGQARLRDLLRQLYVLIPVFDHQKHYFIGEAEVAKLTRAGEGWLAGHPERDLIARRYLSHRPQLVNLAVASLSPPETSEEPEPPIEEPEKALSLAAQRTQAVLAELKTLGARSALDLGCGQGHLLALLLKDRQFERLVGMDASPTALSQAQERLGLHRASESLARRVQLFQGALTYRDARLAGFDAAVALEVIEHLDPARLPAFERVCLQWARPKALVITTPNREYNVNYPRLIGDFRHSDHRFEWTRTEFQAWAQNAGAKFGYQVRFADIGPPDPELGAPTQMGVLTRDN
ncbi:MAG: 3' terminal RNA ribose 2'-O-methyltransferase Hen1 [Deltaproteobacteria bacterium]|jgi:3' terminal RNA ribose 2'-O-methyltransferase Hen1|nr:3' terminal RNA ribose 2'-O-methyltransferase Hen1 [Deltaproteobacteria bacterium]